MSKRRCFFSIAVVSVAMLIAAYLTQVLIPKSVSPTVGVVRLNIETYFAGENQPTHPSVVSFSTAWNGAKYWLAYSPYPYGRGEEENPCIAVSNDMLYWETPHGLANPIADNEETGCRELKDPHLLYRDDMDRLEMWYLGRVSERLGGDGNALLLMRKYSYDGIVWSEYEVMSAMQYLSPTVMWDGDKYQMWSIGYDLYGTTGTVAYQESADGFTWSEPVLCQLGRRTTDIDIWHGSVNKFEGKYHLVYVDESDKHEVFYCESTDGITFSEPKVIIENSGFWDYLYRPTLVFDNDKVICLYGVVNQERQWYISMSSGENVDHMIGIDAASLQYMKPLADIPIDTHSLRWEVKTLYHMVESYIRFELFALAAFELCLLGCFKRLRKNITVAFLVIINLLLSVVYIRPSLSTFTAWMGFLIAIGGINISIAAILQCVSLFLQKGTKNEN